MSEKKLSSLQIVEGQFKNLLEKCLLTNDNNERARLIRRLNNLAGVIYFLISLPVGISKE